jgi:hypothetical protein
MDMTDLGLQVPSRRACAVRIAAAVHDRLQSITALGVGGELQFLA